MRPTRRIAVSDTDVALRKTFAPLVQHHETFFLSQATVGGKQRVVVVTDRAVFVCGRSSRVKTTIPLGKAKDVSVVGGKVLLVLGDGVVHEMAFDECRARQFAAAMSVHLPEVGGTVYMSKNQFASGNFFTRRVESQYTNKSPSRRNSEFYQRKQSSATFSPRGLASLSSDDEDSAASENDQMEGSQELFTPRDLPDELRMAEKGSLEVIHGQPCVVRDRDGKKGNIVGWKGDGVCGVAEVSFDEDNDLLKIRRVVESGEGWGEVGEFTVRGTFPFDMVKGEEVLQARGGVKWSFDRRDVTRSKIRGIFRTLPQSWSAVFPPHDTPFFGDKTTSRTASTSPSITQLDDTRGGSTEYPEECEPPGPARSPTATFSITSPYTPTRHTTTAQDTICIEAESGTPLGIVIHKDKMVLSKVAKGSPADEAGAATYVGREILLVNNSPFDSVGEALERRVGGVLTVTFGGVKEATPPPEHPVVSEVDVATSLPRSSPTHSQGRAVYGRSAETGLQYVSCSNLPTDLRTVMNSVTSGRTLALHFCGVVMQSGSNFESSKRRVLLVTQPCVYLFRPQGTVSRFMYTSDIECLYIPPNREDWIGIKSTQHNDMLLRIVEGPGAAKKLVETLRAVHSASCNVALKIIYNDSDVPSKLSISKADWGLRPTVPPIPCLVDSHSKEISILGNDGLRESGFVKLIGSSWKPTNKLAMLPSEYARHVDWLLQDGVPDITYTCTTGGEHPGVCVITPEGVYSFSSTHRQVLEFGDISEVLITATSLVIFSTEYHTIKLPGLEDVDEVFEVIRQQHPTVVTTKRRERVDDGMHRMTKAAVPIPVYVYVNSGSTSKHVLKLDETMGIHYQETQRSVAVIGVDDGSNAMKAGMRENTTILTADDRAVHTIDDLKAIMMSAIADKRSAIVLETLDMLPSALDPSQQGLPSPKHRDPPAIGHPPIQEATNLPYTLQERFTLALMKATSSVFYMGLVKKIGAKRSQARVLILSEQVLYLTDPNGAVKRAMRISNIRELLLTDPHQIGFKVPSDYDLLIQVDHLQDPVLQTEEVNTITKILSALYKHQTNCTLMQSNIAGKPLRGMLVLKKPEWVRKAVKNKKKQNKLML